MAPRTRAPITDDELLEAGWSIVREELGWRSDVFVQDEDLSTSTMLSSIRARDVIAKANVSPGAFYRRWDSIGKYLADLSRFILERKRHEHRYLAVALEAFEEAALNGKPLPTIIQEVTAVDLAITSESVDFAVQMYMWSLSRRYMSIRDLLAEQYADVDRAWERNYATALAWRGLHLRPDVNISDLTALITALAEGLAIRHVVDPETGSKALLASGVMAVLAATVDWNNDSMSLESWLDSLSSR